MQTAVGLRDKDGSIQAALMTLVINAEPDDVTVLVDGEEYCNPVQIHGDGGGYILGCGSSKKHHYEVQEVSILVKNQGEMRCDRHVKSNTNLTMFPCIWEKDAQGNPIAQVVARDVETPTPINLVETTEAAAWILIETESEGSLPQIKVWFDPDFDVEDTHSVDVLVDGQSYCNSTRMYADEGKYILSCGLVEKDHAEVERVSVQTRNMGDMRCQRNIRSTEEQSVFACVWR